MTNKQIQSLVKPNSNLCEINREYPLFKHSPPSRHLYTGEISVKPAEHINIEKLVKQIITEHLTKDSKEQTTEMIDLFPFVQEEELKRKLYKKCRYQRRTDRDDANERDNTN